MTCPVLAKTIVTAFVFIGFVCDPGLTPVWAGSMAGTEMILEEAYPTVSHINYTWGPFVVGDNPAVTELTIPGLVPFVLDVYGSSATFLFPDADQSAVGSFNGYILVDDSVEFTGVSVDPSTTLSGFDNSRVSFDAHSIYINCSALSETAGDTLTIDISSVPEPSSLLLAAMGCCIALVSARLGGLRFAGSARSGDRQNSRSRAISRKLKVVA